MALKAVAGAIDQAKLSPSGENEDIIPFMSNYVKIYSRTILRIAKDGSLIRIGL